MPASDHSFFTGWMPFLPPNQQRQRTEGICTTSNRKGKEKEKDTLAANHQAAQPWHTYDKQQPWLQV